jgi:WD40 repeat protein/tetratricopeptide (TPR) repeat protein
LSTLGYSGASRKELLAWSLNEEVPRRLSNEYMPDYVKGDISPDGRLFAVSGHTVSAIRLIDTTSGQVVRTLHNEATTIDTLTFSDDGERLVACSTSGEVLSWELGQQDDLFKLRSNPLRNVRYLTHAVSDDLSLVAVANTDGSIVVRARDGQETILRATPPQNATLRPTLLFSPDNKRLAYSTVRRPRGSSGPHRHFVEMYDLASADRLWRIEREQVGGDPGLVFTPDSRQLVLSSFSNSDVIDCQSGEAKQTVSPRGRLFFSRRLFKQRPSARVLQIGTRTLSQGRHSICLQDAVSGEVLAEVDAPEMNTETLSQIIPAEDGRHFGLIRRNTRRAEVWDLIEQRLIVEANGDQVYFSRDGKQVAIAELDSLPVVAASVASGEYRALGKFTVWSTVDGQLLSTISLAGNHADEIRFSPDNRRLVTLHGKRAIGSGGAVPQARLWDVLSGREIMSIPVADINHYVWEIEFDETGHRLTTLVLAKAWGTAGGWGSTVYDATPLGEHEDAQLIAGRLVEELRATTPLPGEVIDALESDENIKPRIRDLAIELATQIASDPDTIASFILPIITSKDRSSKDYRQALHWAEVLQSIESNSVRTNALLGGAQLRCGNVTDALVTLSANEKQPAGNEGEDADQQSPFAFLRQSLLVLALSQNGQRAEARAQADRLRSTYLRTGQSIPGGISMVETYIQVNRLFPPREARLALANATLPDERRIDELFARTDTAADGKLTESEAAATPFEWSDFLYFDESRDAVINRDEFRSAMQVITRWRLVSHQINEGLYEPAAKNLDEALNLAPALPFLLNGRAWLRATCPDEKLRNGRQAVEDATKACEATGWKNSEYLDTLAAALAEAGDFANAIKRQEQAVALAGAVNKFEMQLRLDGYRQNKPFRTPAIDSFADPTEQPLLTSDVVSNSRRVAGWGASWSPDGKKLVRNLIFRSNHTADLEIIDLEKGATTKLCNGGADPYWSPRPDGPIAFARGPKGEPRTPINESIWLVQPDGSELREVGHGGFPSWANDGRLFYRTISGNDVQLIEKTINRDGSAGGASPIPGGLYPTISPDGTLVAVPTQSRLAIRDRVNNTEVASLDLAFGNLVSAGWSPDGRYIVYGAYTTGFPGLWIWDFRAGIKRLLTTEPLTMARWSPDGKTIAADARALNEVVLLDVSPLNLQNGLPGAPSVDTAEGAISSGVSVGGNAQAAP